MKRSARQATYIAILHDGSSCFSRFAITIVSNYQPFITDGYEETQVIACVYSQTSIIMQGV